MPRRVVVGTGGRIAAHWSVRGEDQCHSRGRGLQRLRNPTGIILPYVTLILVAIVGVSALALDASRYMSLQTQLQNGADALALAGAAELDRMPTAMARATRAIDTLVTNSSLFGIGSERSARVAEIRFLRMLPIRDSDQILPGYWTSDPTQAAFVEVTVEPIGLPTILPAAFFGGSKVLAADSRRWL